MVVCPCQVGLHSDLNLVSVVIIDVANIADWNVALIPAIETGLWQKCGFFVSPGLLVISSIDIGIDRHRPVYRVLQWSVCDEEWVIDFGVESRVSIHRDLATVFARNHR